MNLTEKYRPKNFEQVIGHKLVIDSLKPLVLEKKHSSFLFEGPSGVGKTTLARICASELGCKGPDLVEFDAASYSGIDDIRGITKYQNSYPGFGDARVFIVDECQRLSKQAWDAMLKSIEDPQPKNYWFFCTSEISKVPRAIVTRCARFTLKPVDTFIILAWLLEIRDNEMISLNAELVKRIASSVQGSPREALIRMQQCDGFDEAQVDQFLRTETGLPGGYELARLLSDQGFSMTKAMEMCKEMKDESPEAIRQVVRAYMTTIVLNSPGNGYAMGVLQEFSAPAVEQNYISDIVLRIARINKWRKA